MKYTITLCEKDGRYLATAVDDEKSENAAADAADPFTAMQVITSMIADREIEVMKRVYPGWVIRREKFHKWLEG